MHLYIVPLTILMPACHPADPDASTRSKAVRLCANQLALLSPDLAQHIEACAGNALALLVQGPPPAGSGPGGSTPEAWTEEEAARFVGPNLDFHFMFVLFFVCVCWHC